MNITENVKLAKDAAPCWLMFLQLYKFLTSKIWRPKMLLLEESSIGQLMTPNPKNKA